MPLARIQARMQELKEWSLEGSALMKEYSFPDFKETMIFVNNVAELAENMQHHPSFLVNYDQVRITITTHSEGGLTDLDFALAKAIDELASFK